MDLETPKKHMPHTSEKTEPQKGSVTRWFKDVGFVLKQPWFEPRD